MQTSENPLDIFIEGWSRMGGYWGIGKVMAEIQALLYLSAEPLSLEEMSEKLATSRSNISLNVRALQDLGVVKKVIVRGDRKDYYTAETDVGRVARLLAAAKKKRELDPAIEIVDRAIEAANMRPSSERDKDHINKDRLYALKYLMEVIGGVFNGFIESDEASIHAKSQNG